MFWCEHIYVAISTIYVGYLTLRSKSAFWRRKKISCSAQPEHYRCHNLLESFHNVSRNQNDAWNTTRKLLIDRSYDFPDVSSRCNALFLDFKGLTHINQEFLNAQKDLLLSFLLPKKHGSKGKWANPNGGFMQRPRICTNQSISTLQISKEISEYNKFKIFHILTSRTTNLQMDNTLWERSWIFQIIDKDCEKNLNGLQLRLILHGHTGKRWGKPCQFRTAQNF